ncbi:hypothetical protein [Eudoraea sp.]|uniref:hypothetical protein n=1 Tax=Eudoraea sp. TaxID=1979955 RepID=UPI003C721A87
MATIFHIGNFFSPRLARASRPYANHLIAKGKFLDIVIEGNSKYVIYAIDMFFVEVIWDIETDEIIGKGQFCR